MTARSVSPGGALLRASRVFAIPPALPRPAGNLSSTAIFNSDTATLPHPIRLSITTPQTSLARGDWGFKRPLPLRSTTKSSTPLIRVEAIDTYEHITEYASAADHTINMQKWLEMGVPLTVPVVDDVQTVGAYKSQRRQSVFEDHIDYTTGPPTSGKDDTRWKFKGPYLANQSEGDFVDFISNEVRKRRDEFQTYLRTACANALTARARIASTEEMPAAIQAADITQEQMTAYVKELREDRVELYKHIRVFLDLAPVAPPSSKDMQGLLQDLIENGLKDAPLSVGHFASTLSPYAASGPPKTHPSAGLSYARTAAYTANHPQFGPQKNHTPIKARVVRPKGGAGGAFGATLGVGGFVTDLPAGHDSFNLGNVSKRPRNMASAIPGALQIEPHKVGGSKTYVHPSHATVNSKGNIIMTVDAGEPEAIAVLENTTDQIPEPPAQRKPLVIDPRRFSRSIGMASYGLGGGGSPFAAPAPTANQDDPMKALTSLLDS